jgi:hypothetical protein
MVTKNEGVCKETVNQLLSGIVIYTVEDQTFLRSYDFGSTPAPSPVSKLDRRHTGRLRKRDNLLTGKGKGGGVDPNHTTTVKLVLL